MLGDYFLVVTGSITMSWTCMAIRWSRRNPAKTLPLILTGGPLITAVLAIIEGVSRVT